MDTSIKYIEMCNVKEIQDLWIPEYGDFYIDNHDTRRVIGTRIEKEFSSDRPLPIPFTWLPRQDQLQEIMKGTHTIGSLIKDLAEFYDPESVCPDTNDIDRKCKCQYIGKSRRLLFDSIEQFQLALSMDELYKKEWDGKRWISKEVVIDD